MNESDILQFKQWFFALDLQKQKEFISNLSSQELLEFRYTSDLWLRPEQVITDGLWRYCLLLAGRAFGKSHSATAWISKQVKNYNPQDPPDQFALIAPTAEDARNLLIPTYLKHFPPHQKPYYNSSHKKIYHHNHAEVLVYSSEQEIRGPNLSKVVCDEIVKWNKPTETFDILDLGIRLNNAKVVISTTPKMEIELLHRLVKKAETDSTIKIIKGGTMYDNKDNLDPQYIKSQESLHAGSRFYRQEIAGELLSSMEDAMFSIDNINKNRHPANLDEKVFHLNLPKDVQLIKIVISVDPAGSANLESDETGITVVGLANNGHAYVLKDASGRFQPPQWGKKAIDLYYQYRANAIIAETNFGAQMVISNIRMLDPNVFIKEVRASHGKLIRAEPISTKYYQDKVHHVGEPRFFSALEKQMMYFTGTSSNSKKKDDRLDSLVWALTDLFPPLPAIPRSTINMPNFG